MTFTAMQGARLQAATRLQRALDELYLTRSLIVFPEDDRRVKELIRGATEILVELIPNKPLPKL